MESMTINSFVPPSIASTSNTVPDNNADKIDNDAMETNEIEAVGTKTIGPKRSRSLTPSIPHTVKSRRLDFNVVDQDEVSGQRAVTSADSDIINNIIPAVLKSDLKTCVVPKFDRFIYISQFKPDTSADKIRNFVVEKLNCKTELIFCQKLVSTKRDPSLPLSFVSFKIGTSKHLAKKILKNGFWPAGLIAKEFEDHSKNAKAPRQTQTRIMTTQSNQQPQNARPVISRSFNKASQQAMNNHQNGRQRNQQAPVGQQRRQHNSTMTWRVSQK